MKHTTLSRRTICGAALSLLVAAVGIGCGGGSDDSPPEGTRAFYEFNFTESAEGWEGGFADLPVEHPQDLYELGFTHAELQPDLLPTRKAVLISGHNRSDDLFMYMSKQLEGLRPSTEYDVTFDIQICSNAAEGLAGIGGGPGVAVYLKAGATTQKPDVVTEDGYLRINLDKGNQSVGGRDMVVLGDIGIPNDVAVYTYKRLNNNDAPLRVRTDSAGKVYVIVGTDSGFEGKTDLYYTQARLTLDPVLTG
jgi:hypothetical protein